MTTTMMIYNIFSGTKVYQGDERVCVCPSWPPRPPRMATHPLVVRPCKQFLCD